jgi:iron complex transport system ATP-binding protein
MLELKNMEVSLGGQPIVKDVSLRVGHGEMLGLLGPNGAGKSTLLRSILQLIPVQRGRIELDGQPANTIPIHTRARKMAYVPQQGPVNWPLTVERLVALGRLPHLSGWQQPSPQDQQTVERILKQTDLEHLRDRPATTLSGGERTRVLLARALAVDAPLLLADEPVAALDPAHQLQIMQLLRAYCDTGHAVIVVMHDLTLAARYCHRLALMHEGKLVTSGSAREVLNPENLATVYNIDARYSQGDEFYIIPWQRVVDRD